MATKKENRKEALALIKELGLEVELPAVAAENSEYWQNVVSDLKAKKRDAQLSSVADGVEPDEHVVAPGKTITSLRGILVAGEIVKDSDLSGDDEVAKAAFQNLVDKEYLVGKE
jgi:hypothetical protein